MFSGVFGFMTERLFSSRRGFLALCLATGAGLGVGGAAWADQASAAAAVQRLLQRDVAPAGVVFDIVSTDPKYLDSALAKVNAWEAELHARFPALDVAVVSHGKEQLALTVANQPLEFTANSLAAELLGNNVALHVCGLHATVLGVSADEYPDHIDVTPSGPAKIAEYVDRGYVLIVL